MTCGGLTLAGEHSTLRGLQINPPASSAETSGSLVGSAAPRSQRSGPSATNARCIRARAAGHLRFSQESIALPGCAASATGWAICGCGKWHSPDYRDLLRM